MTQARSFRIAAVQACSAYLDRERSVDKACALIAEAGEGGAQLAVFPEAFIPGYPIWAWHIPAGHSADLRDAYSLLHANSVAIPDDSTRRLCEAARAAGVAVVMGVNERNSEASDSTLFNTALYIGADGAILGKHRKLVPTGGERLIWGRGDGSDLDVYALPFARLGGLICWENYMPLARYALSAWGEQIHAALTWDRGEPWLSTMRHIAKEGRSFVIGCCQAVRRDDIPDHLPFMAKYLAAGDEWINPGDSVIVDPDGKIVAGPAHQVETILYADVQHDQLVGPRSQLDVAGHYARPDVFELLVHRTPTPVIRSVDADTPRAAESVRPGRSRKKNPR
jgi:nitrilase